MILCCRSNLKDQLSAAMGDEEVVVLAGNSAAFRAIVISLTIFLGALIGAILLCELLVYFYQRFVRRNTVDKEGNYWPPFSQQCDFFT